jgi:hypothetical protein
MPDPMSPNPVAAQVTTPSPVLGVNNPSVITNPQAGVGPEPAQPPVDMSGQAPSMGAPSAPSVKGPSPWQRAVHALLGSQTEFQQGPNGPVPVQVPNKPGNLFRSILAGAILGAGAGTANAEHNAGSGWGAAGAGARAVQENQQQQQQLKAAQAQKQFENQQEVDRADREKQMAQAQIANFQAETAVRTHTMDLMDQDRLDKHNDANRALYNSLVAAGGTPPPESELPGTISAYDLAQAYTKNPKIRQPQYNTNMTRHFIDTTTAQDVSFDPIKKIWVGEDGKPVDMTAKTEFKVIDVPIDNMTKKVQTKNSDIFAALGFAVPGMDPKGTSLMAPVDLINLRANKMKQDRESHAAETADRQNKIAEYTAAEGKVTRDNEALKTQLEEFKNDPTADPGGAKAASLNARMDANNAWLDGQYETIWGTKKSGEAPKTPPPPPADPVAKVLGVAQGISDPNTALQMINNAPGLTPSQKKDLTTKYTTWLAQKSAPPVTPPIPPQQRDISGIQGSFQ